ncbi:prolyl oligopeptidase family serine peptidase [Gemmatimonadota bacterium]
MSENCAGSRRCRRVGGLFVAFLSVAAFHAPLHGQQRLDLSLENIFQARGGVSAVAMAPDGDEVAVTAEGAEGRGIYLVAIDGQSEPVFWVQGNSPVWDPDGGFIVFSRGGQLWRVDVGSTEPVQVTTDLDGVRAPALSPDGRTLAFYSSASGSQDIWLVPSDGSQPPRQLTEGSMTVDETRFEPGWSPDGTTIAYVANQADFYADDVWLVDVSSGRARQLSDSIRAISTAPVWSPDGSQIVVLGTTENEYWYLDIADIYLLDPNRGTQTRLEMQTYATAYQYRPFWSADGTRIFFPYMERGEHNLWVVPAAGGVATRVTNLGGVQSGFDADRDVSGFVFLRGSATDDREVHYIPRTGGPARRITQFGRTWSGLKAPVEVAYQSFDGLYIQGFLYLPEEVANGQMCPALVQVHGGGTNSYMNGLNLTEQYLASKGFVVLAINYRGGSGFGREFQSISDEDWLNDQAKDPGSAADYLRTLPYVNGRVGIYGYSYGGMQSMAAITRTPDKFDAAVPMAGVYSEALTFPYQDRLGMVFTVDGHGGLPEERPEIYEKTNTLSRMGNITAPVLIMHGEEDVRAPFLNFQLAVEELEKHGKEYESHTYPEGHGFRDPANRIDMYQRLEAFLTRHLGSCRRQN